MLYDSKTQSCALSLCLFTDGVPSDTMYGLSKKGNDDFIVYMLSTLVISYGVNFRSQLLPLKTNRISLY
jgi:hypothetical protein